MSRHGITQLEILNGWKEIAKYLGKGVRTVQRYEHKLGLPIRRSSAGPKGSVIATKAEIDAWISARPLRGEFSLSPDNVENTKAIEQLREQLSEMHRLRLEAAQWRNEMAAARESLHRSIAALHERVSLFVGEDPESKPLTRNDPKRKPN